MIKYIFIIGFICLVYVVIFALLKAGSDFDDEVEELYNNFYEDDGLDEEYDYYDNKYKEIFDASCERRRYAMAYEKLTGTFESSNGTDNCAYYIYVPVLPMNV